MVGRRAGGVELRVKQRAGKARQVEPQEDDQIDTGRHEAHSGDEVMALTAGDRERLEAAGERYVRAAAALGVVASVVVGVHPSERRVSVWNVFAEPFAVQQTRNPAFQDLTDLGGQLEEELAELVVVRAANVNPGDVPELLSFCAVRSIAAEHTVL